MRSTASSLMLGRSMPCWHFWRRRSVRRALYTKGEDMKVHKEYIEKVVEEMLIKRLGPEPLPDPNLATEAEQRAAAETMVHQEWPSASPTAKVEIRDILARASRGDATCQHDVGQLVYRISAEDMNALHREVHSRLMEAING